MTKMLFELTVDKKNQTVDIIREFPYNLDLIWSVFTKQEYIDQWIAPKPYTSKTKYMDFKVGGKRFYAMVSPEGVERWALQEYTSITPKTNFKVFGTFTDADGNPEQNGSEWNHTFSESNGITRVHITIYTESLLRMENLLEGFKAGFTMSLENLEDLLTLLNTNI